MDFKEYEEKAWFKELIDCGNEYSNISNMIESAKEKYGRANHIYEWITGVGLGLILSLGIGDIIRNQNITVVIIGYIAYFVAMLAIIVGMWLYILQNKRQEIAFLWLYRELDKQEIKNKPRKKN
jgi:hypothetical protein